MRSEKKKLLLVDDDGVVRATFGRGLKDAGYEVSLAGSGEDGLQMVADGSQPDLAILDMRMPGLSGSETAQGLSQLEVSSIFLSAYDDETFVQQAVTNGALGYLVKPIDVEKAIPTIEAALQRARDLYELRATEKRLDGALETGKLVNVVVGVLMERYRLDRQGAFELLRRKARSERRKVKDVADEILDACDTVNQLLTEKP